MNKKWDLRHLRLAREVASWSKDPSTQVGCVIIAANRSPVSWGYNGFARGVPDDEKYHDRETKYAMVIHAEENAIIAGDRHALKGSTLYVWPFSPCSPCAGKIINAGIAEVVSLRMSGDRERDARWRRSFELAEYQFKKAHVGLRLLDME